MITKDNTKVRELHSNVEEQDNKDSGSNVERVQIDNSPFEVITIDGISFGAMGDYRLTEKGNDKNKVIKELKKVTWNRIIQVFMILNELKEKINIKTEE